MCSPALCSVSAILLSSVLLTLSSPLLLFVCLLLLFFYRVQSLVLVSSWFLLLPDLFFLSAALNLLSGVSSGLLGLLECGDRTRTGTRTGSRTRKAFLLASCCLLVASFATAITSAYGCTELQSVILQQSFLAINIGWVMDQYMTDQTFRRAWDSLQTQYFCCGALNFNTGYRDWKNDYGRLNNSVPDSCCHQPFLNCGSNIFVGVSPPLNIHTHGCLTVIQNKLEQELTLLLTVMMAVQGLMMILALVTLILSLCQASHDYR